MNGLFRHSSASFRRATRISPRRGHLSFEHLEHRLVLATFTVNTLGDFFNPPPELMTLRTAIQLANLTPGSNTINLSVPGTYRIAIPQTGAHNNLSGAFTIIPNAASPKNSVLTIQNTSGGTAVVDGSHLDRVFDINPNNATAVAPFTVRMQGFTVQNGIAQPGDAAAGSGGGIRDQGNVNLSLTNMNITKNIATADGGGVSMENPTVSTFWTLTINNSQITNNHAGDAGGGIETDGSGTTSINTGTMITGNTCVNQGGGIWLDAIQVGDTFQGSSLAVNGATISGNQALSAGGGLGGGIGNAGNGQVTISQSTVANNFAGMNGGGYGDENAQGQLNVISSSFLNNTTVGIGGGITSGGPVTITSCTIANNFAGATGGGFGDQNAQDSLSVDLSTFLNNTAAGSGGGIATAGANTQITRTEIDGNTSGGKGGGLFTTSVTLALQSSTLANNTASDNGGGIELATTGTGAGLGSTITTCTLTGNTALNNAGANGGGIDAGANFTGDVLLLNDTINANFASSNGGNPNNGMGGGIFYAATKGSTFRLQNTIVAGNFAAVAPDAAGTFTDMGGNLIGVSGGGSGNMGFTSATTQTGSVANPLNPLLGPLQDNGGPMIGAPGHTMTLQTELLLTGSPAIGKGILNGAPATDERGFPSVVNGAINVGATSSAATSSAANLGADPPRRLPPRTSHWWSGDDSLNELAALLLQVGSDNKDM